VKLLVDTLIHEISWVVGRGKTSPMKYHKPRPTNEFVGVDGLYVDGVFERMTDSRHIPWPWSKFAVRAVKSEHIKGSWLAGVDKCVRGSSLGSQPSALFRVVLSTPLLHSHSHVVCRVVLLLVRRSGVTRSR
jgi:hypothetical protein